MLLWLGNFRFRFVKAYLYSLLVSILFFSLSKVRKPSRNFHKCINWSCNPTKTVKLPMQVQCKLSPSFSLAAMNSQRRWWAFKYLSKQSGLTLCVWNSIMDSSRADNLWEWELDWASMGLEAPNKLVKNPSFSAPKTELELNGLLLKKGNIFSLDKFMFLLFLEGRSQCRKPWKNDVSWSLLLSRPKVKASQMRPLCAFLARESIKKLHLLFKCKGRSAIVKH